MPKIIVASRYLKPAAKGTRGNLVKYIATRETVQKYSPKKKDVPVTGNQKQLIFELLKINSDGKKLPEYSVYLKNPSKGNASELLSELLEQSADMIADKEILVKYVAERPGVEKIGKHGLFSDSDDEIILSQAQKNIAEHQGNVWSHVISLTREDAERLGYTTPEMWRNLIMRHTDDIAKAQKIRLENLRWYAAFHNTTHHPHIHLLIYSTDIKEGFLTENGIEQIKSAFANDIFHNELYQVYEKQTAVRDKLRSEAESVMKNLLSELQTNSQFDPQLEQLILKMLIDKLPGEHKARWFAGAALNSSDQAMASVMSTALSRLNSFIDSELEQILCFDTSIDVEDFCNHKSAIYLVLPEEDATKHFLISLIFQQLYREILTVADEKGGQLDKRVMFYMDEIGTLPKVDGLEMIFSASRSRKVSIVAIIQSLAQFEKTYGKEGAEIIVDNCQCTLFGAFAPNSKTAEAMSQNLGKQTVLSGTVTRSSGRDGGNRQLQMIERPLMTVDELKSMPKGHFIVMKTGCHPMKTRLKLFFKWGIQFENAYSIEEKSERKVQYADSKEIETVILEKFPLKPVPYEFQQDYDDIIERSNKKRSPKTKQ